MDGFAITGSRGFHITFPNKVTVSVQFGGGNYCENYDMEIGSEPSRHYLGSISAEVAIWQDQGVGKQSCWITKEYTKDDGDVLGRQSATDVLRILNWAARYSKSKGAACR